MTSAIYTPVCCTMGHCKKCFRDLGSLHWEQYEK